MDNNKNYRTFEELPLLLTASEAGNLLRIGRSNIYSLLRCGEIPSIRVKGQIRVPKQAVIDYISNAN